jgi:hypothetical protein
MRLRAGPRRCTRQDRACRPGRRGPVASGDQGGHLPHPDPRFVDSIPDANPGPSTARSFTLIERGARTYHGRRVRDTIDQARLFLARSVERDGEEGGITACLAASRLALQPATLAGRVLLSGGCRLPVPGACRRGRSVPAGRWRVPRVLPRRAARCRRRALGFLRGELPPARRRRVR